ncbi:hypothetical protein H072_3149 [Dactylellina haptotyla CBS 200.50]|uniref:DC-UbP/UBTD2 N-terminal domain-containing protein n=1 Tax=Dactylellina haptotyla (strain CBS 200.50) TaxID=1284197 RepID=S8AJ25_DACHA|nr:hypothetical protein H072_3149 [Dactylellina haptotyla CBS 200.50]
MGNCMSSRRRGGDNNHNDPNAHQPHHHNHHHHNPLDNFPAAYGLGLGPNAMPGSQPSRSHRHDLPLDQRPDRRLKRHTWTHNVDANGPAPTHKQLATQREEFWHTRVTGRQEVWSTVRIVIELLMADPSDDALVTAREILKAAEITIPSGDLTGSVYDVLGNRYKFPAYVVCNPTNVRDDSSPRSSSDSGVTASTYKSDFDESSKRRHRDLKGKSPAGMTETEVGADLEGVYISARFRLNDGTDYQLEFWSDEKIKNIQLGLMKKAGVDPSTHRVRLMLDGHELQRDRTLPSYDAIPHWHSDRIILAYVQDLGVATANQQQLPVGPPSPVETSAAAPLPAPQPQAEQTTPPPTSENQAPLPTPQSQPSSKN